MYSVNFWGSKPGTDDDCWYGQDFDTLEEAEALYNAPVADEPCCSAKCVAYVELDGPNVHKERPNPTFKPDRDTSDREWRRERQMEAAMLHGVQGYNDYEGM